MRLWIGKWQRKFEQELKIKDYFDIKNIIIQKNLKTGIEVFTLSQILI